MVTSVGQSKVPASMELQADGTLKQVDKLMRKSTRRMCHKRMKLGPLGAGNTHI